MLVASRYVMPFSLSRNSTHSISLFHNQTGVPPKVFEKTDANKIVREVELQCCKHRCIRDIPLRTIKERREMFWRKPLNERRIVLDNAIKHSRDGKLWVDGRLVCPNAWCTVYGVSQRRYTVVLHWLCHYKYKETYSTFN